MALVVTGTIGIDTVHTPAASRERILGGSAVYFAAAASHFGPVRLVAAVHDTSVAMIEKHYGAFIVDAAEDLLRAAAVPLVPAEVVTLAERRRGAG